MCNKTPVGENQLQRIIRDLHACVHACCASEPVEAVTELSKEHRETGEPITDNSPNLHKLSYKLEYLLQFDQKEKADFLGSRKEYWDYFRECLAKTRGVNDGLRLYQSEWYFARSPFLKSHLSSDIISQLYVLNEVQFDVASRSRPRCRHSSEEDLLANTASIYDQLPEAQLRSLFQCQQPGQLLRDDLRILVDHSELRQKELLHQSEARQVKLLQRVRELDQEAERLRTEVRELQGKLLAHNQEAVTANLNNMDLLSKLDSQEKERDTTLQQTQVLQEGEERDSTLQQTQVLQEGEERGAALQQTQVLQEGEERGAALQQTQVLQEGEERDATLQQTQVLQEGEERDSTLQQTQVLQEGEERDAALQQTQVLQQGEERDAALQQTQVLQEGEERDAALQQTQVLQQGEERDAALQQTQVLQEEERKHKAGSEEGLSMEKNQHLSSKSEPQTQDLSPCPQTQQLLHPAVLVAQLQRSQGEVLRLQTEVVELRARLQLGAELQIRSQVEGLNRQQVEELLLAQEREEALGQEQRRKAQASQGLVLELASAREELHSLKTRYEGLALEHGDIREALDHNNRETAELGVHICRLTAQNEEARERWEVLSNRFQEELNTSMTSLQQENLGLQEQLLKEREEKGRLGKEEQGKVRAQKEAQQEEIQALRYQLSNQTINHQTQLQIMSEELKTVRSEVEVEQENNLYLKTKLRGWRSGTNIHTFFKSSHSFLTSTLQDLLTTEHVVVVVREEELMQQREEELMQQREEELIQQREEELIQQREEELQHNLTRSEESLVVSQRSCEELREGLRKACQDKQSYELRTSAELDDLYSTKINLEERLIELIRERCCPDCYSQYTAGFFSSRRYLYYLAVPRADDGAYGIITEEEGNSVSNSDSLSFTACSPHTNPQGEAELNGGASTAETTSEDQTGAVQDAEICLLRSGELTVRVPFSVEEISVFGDGLRELFIRSGCYSSIPITGSTLGATIHWLFTSQPKSISFSVLYREDTHTPLEEAKVLIPLTRCQSHKETMTGELIVYTLIFDNSFSRFISKKVLYRLSVEQPVVYDGTH
uniref:FYVE and coiled-coil domain-containing protein 1-like n=1 Tax=Oncorhynchus gorbuscha TaxID=8017 RepID=UPI001EAEA125|nr:FYVE and coiled-coil domain-containing protein 1-like [Oncorhynchus gorbuscha]